MTRPKMSADHPTHSPDSDQSDPSQLNKACPAQIYQPLKRTWAARATSVSMKETTQRSDTDTKPALQRWMEESVRKEPWNNVRSFAAVSLSEGQTRAGEEVGSNSAAARTYDQVSRTID